MMSLLWTCLGLTTSLAGTTSASDIDTCESTGAAGPRLFRNSAFVFVKPHANTEGTRSLVQDGLKRAGIEIIQELDINGSDIDKKGLIDQHYYSIASKATILPAKEIPVPADKFEQSFGEPWDLVLKENRACNAMEACIRFECTPAELNEAWQKTEAVKFGGGFYCGRVSVNSKPELYVFNAFFMAMRSKFIGEENSIHCYVVEWDPSKLSWKSFRNEILGPTDPATAPKTSIRRRILDEYKNLGLKSKPNKGDNGVHASASPFEGLAEKANWLGQKIADDSFGRALLENGMSKSRINAWLKDPQIQTSESATGSVFDILEDLDANECLEKLITLNRLN